MPGESLRIVRIPSEVLNHISAARLSGKRVGIVPTMGALHEGHLSLVREAQRSCEYTVVTIFVNPSQFGPTEDFTKYPRTTDQDLDALRELDVELVFLPNQDALYPAGFSTYVQPPAVAEPFEGRFRPEHFRGVATIVLKLFNLLPANVAYFGQKDYQQCQVIRHMVEDLNVPIEIEACPIIREPDGLAMSSRNRYLSPEERARAVSLSAALNEAVSQFHNGVADTARLSARMRDMLHRAGVTTIDYAEIADANTLEAMTQIDRPAVALIAAYVGATRLIDNALLVRE